MVPENKHGDFTGRNISDVAVRMHNDGKSLDKIKKYLDLQLGNSIHGGEIIEMIAKNQ